MRARSDLCLAVRVVQHQQRRPVGQGGTEHVGASLGIVRDVLGRYFQRQQQPAQDFGRVRGAQVHTAQIGMQPGVRKTRPQLVREVRHQRRLPDAARSPHAHHRALADQHAQLGDFLDPVGEVGNVGTQLRTAEVPPVLVYAYVAVDVTGLDDNVRGAREDVVLLVGHDTP
jgi:hypothetical protein